MYSNKKSFVTGVAILYLLMALYEFRWIDNLNEQLDDVEVQMTQMTELEREMNDLEGCIDDLYDTCDSLDNSISILSARISALEVKLDSLESTEDIEKQIADEIKEGEIEALAQLVEAEAGNQDYIGKCLVADVVLNRVDSNKFPAKPGMFADTIEGIISEHYIRKSDGEDCYQFSTVKYGAYEEAGWHISEESYAAARQEYESERLDDRILYFTAGYYNPCCIPAYVHGDHYFGY